MTLIPSSCPGPLTTTVPTLSISTTVPAWRATVPSDPFTGVPSHCVMPPTPVGSQGTWVSPVYLSSVPSRPGRGQGSQAPPLAAACWFCSQLSSPVPKGPSWASRETPSSSCSQLRPSNPLPSQVFRSSSWGWGLELQRTNHTASVLTYEVAQGPRYFPVSCLRKRRARASAHWALGQGWGAAGRVWVFGCQPVGGSRTAVSRFPHPSHRDWQRCLPQRRFEDGVD